MKIIKKLLILLSLFFFVSLYIIKPVSSTNWVTLVTLTGSESDITQNFEITRNARFVWICTYNNASTAYFRAYLYEVGDQFWRDYLEGFSGTYN